MSRYDQSLQVFQLQPPRRFSILLLPLNRNNCIQEANMASKTLYVGNLPYSASESDLTNHFSKYNASNARIIEGRGFGFIDIDADQLEAAVADNNQQPMNGRTLTVNEAQPKGSSGGNRSSGGGSRGGRW
jgi:cold-inducible RNA-binding protein